MPAERVTDPGNAASSADVPAEPLYLIVLKTGLALLIISIALFILLLAASFLEDMILGGADEVSTDVFYLIGQMYFWISMIAYGLMLLASVYLIAGGDRDGFIERMRLRLDRNGCRLILACALLGAVAFISIMVIALLTGSLYYVDNEIRMVLSIMNGSMFINHPGMIDQVPFLSLIISLGMFMALALATGFGQEALIRGYLQRSLTGKYGAFAAVGSIALLSGALSYVAGGGILKTVDTFLFSALCGYLYLMTGSLLAPAGFAAATHFLHSGAFPSSFYSSRLLYMYLDHPVELAGVSMGEAYFAVSIAISGLLLILLLYYNEKRREIEEARVNNDLYRDS